VPGFAQLLRLCLVCLFLGLVGCSSGGGSGGGAPSGGGGPNVVPPPPPPQTGSILLRFTLQQRAVPVEVTQLRLSAFSPTGSLLKGPETFAKAAELNWTNVPAAATRLQIEYLVAQGVAGLASIPISINPGGQIEIRDPDFQTVEATLSSIEVTAASSSLPRGTATQLTATGVFDDNSRRDLSSSVTWTSIPAGVVSINAQGLTSGVDAGSTTVRASLGAVSGTVQLQVTAAVLREIQFSRPNLSLAAGTQSQVQATGIYSDGTSVPITNSVSWSSTAPDIASVNGGLVSGLQTGETEIVASLAGMEARLPITVTGATLRSIQASSPALSLAKGTSTQLFITGIFSDGSSQPLTPDWASLAPGTAAVSSDGTVSALSEGETSVVATFGTFQVSVPLTVTAAELRRLQLSAANFSLPRGTAADVTVTGFFSDGSSQDLTETATWSSDAPAVASVSKGRVQALTQGQTTIRAALNDVQSSVEVTVSAATLQRLELSAPSLTLPKGTQQSLSATGFYSDGSSADITAQVVWQSSEPAIAQVNGGQVTGMSEGSTEVVASLSGVEDRADIAVTAAVLRSLEIVPDSHTVAVGTFADFTVNGTYSDGSVQPLTAAVTWQTADTSVAHISNSDGSRGRVTGLTQGSTAVTATLNGVQDEATVSVTAAVPVGLSIGPDGASVGLNHELPLTAEARLSDNSLVDVTSQSTWRSLDETRAIVVSPGRLRGVALGNVTIEASYQGQTTQFTLLVGYANAYAPISSFPDFSISRSGQLVATVKAEQRIPGQSSSVVMDVRLYDVDTGTSRLVSYNTSGNPAMWDSQEPSVSANADLVAFRSYSPDLVAGDTNRASDIFVRDMNSGVLTRASVNAQGQEAGGLYPFSWAPRIAANGRFVAFVSYADNLVPNDVGYIDDVFVKDLETGFIERVNVSSTGAAADRPTFSPGSASRDGKDDLDNIDRVSISADGRYVAYHSDATTLVDGDTNGVKDVFVHDRQTHQTQRVSVTTAGVQGAQLSRDPELSADGSTVVFLSRAALVPADTNGRWDTYARDLSTGVTSIVSTTENGTVVNADSFGSPNVPISVSDDGRFVSFPSTGSLVPEAPFTAVPAVNAFVKDRQTGRIWLANRDQAGQPLQTGLHLPYLSGDGRFVFWTASFVNQFLPSAPANSSGLVRAFNRLAVGP
jgi:hypothetical protein